MLKYFLLYNISNFLLVSSITLYIPIIYKHICFISKDFPSFLISLGKIFEELLVHSEAFSDLYPHEENINGFAYDIQLILF